MSIRRRVFLAGNRAVYGALRPLIFRSSAQAAHERMMGLLRRADGQGWLQSTFGAVHRLAWTSEPVTVGGVTLPHPLVLAAGLVKGEGFESEDAALAAVAAGRNIMPGWRSIPRLVGLVEFGSFTRWPRVGNPGTVVWRDVPTRSTQNRVGLRNPGVKAAAAFLGARRDRLPPQFGINIAVSPGVHDPEQQAGEVLEGLAAFIEQDVRPTWFTLNLSCPNTEDDPAGHQTAEQAMRVCGAAVAYLGDAAPDVPLWVKVGPDLSAEQYRALVDVFVAVGVRAVVATNTLPVPAPSDAALTAGVGGGRLHAQAVAAVRVLVEACAGYGDCVSVIGCGGVLDGATYRDFADLGAAAAQYWTALVYRGPLAAALITDEAHRLWTHR